MDEMEMIATPAYKKAFNDYLRRGVLVEWSLKQAAARGELSLKAAEHPSTHYVWRTRGDGRVRATHAANNGRIFAWDYPPATGHPGEDYGCRCVAEPYVRGESEFAYQTMMSAVHDSSPKWKLLNFVWHAIKHGDAVTLSEIGHLQDILNHYAYVAKRGVFERVNRQVIDKARRSGSGYFTHGFSNNYSFKVVAFPFGGSTVKGEFRGYVSRKSRLMRIDGAVEYFFEDEYTDPVGIRQWRYGTSDPAVVSAIERYLTDGGGGVYAITGQWQTSFRAEAKFDESQSRYQWTDDE
ncbi:MAG: phage minor head protein [Pseudomonadota bacterium]